MSSLAREEIDFWSLNYCIPKIRLARGALVCVGHSAKLSVAHTQTPGLFSSDAIALLVAHQGMTHVLSLLNGSAASLCRTGERNRKGEGNSVNELHFVAFVAWEA